MSLQSLNVPVPEAGTLTYIDDDIAWLRMPLPFQLDHINLYLVRDGDAFTAIDTGLHTTKTMEIWDEIFASQGVSLSKVIVTHMHPDHIGNAGWLTERFEVPLHMTHKEYFVARAIRAGDQGASTRLDEQFMQRAGLSQDAISRSLQRRNGIRHVISPIPLSFERMRSGDEIQIGSTVWKVIVGKGHSPEHACLYCADKSVLISGDHVLPFISPNIGVYSTEPNANSLKQYLDTLPQFLNLPADTVVLPAHKQPFIGLHQRVNELITHHHDHLQSLIAFCEHEKTLVDCLPVLFKRELDEQSMFFAVAECLSHLNYLVFDGSMTRELRNGVWHYKTL